MDTPLRFLHTPRRCCTQYGPTSVRQLALCCPGPTLPCTQILIRYLRLKVQGAAQAIENAACLAELFGKVERCSQILDTLIIFQALRQARCLEISRRAEKVGQTWTLPDHHTDKKVIGS
jgi:hypothetical protein